jgi:hypothetical protein
VNNDEKATTAVTRAIRPTTLQTRHPNRVRPGKGRESRVRLKSTVDVEQLRTRGKLRRVERHRERSKRNENEPRRNASSTLRGRSVPSDNVGERRSESRPFGVRTDGTLKPRPLLALGIAEHKERVRHATRLDRPETWRTPWSAAGCNKPAKCQVEQAVEAERNGKGGTSPGRGSPGPKVATCRRATSLEK